MGRFDRAKMIEDLLALKRNDIPRHVDSLIDAYLVGTDSEQLWQKRAELALEFLDAAPFSELSYRIWRRISGEDDDEMLNQYPSMQFLPPVDFQISR
jgi:hypothetical protein